MGWLVIQPSSNSIMEANAYSAGMIRRRSVGPRCRRARAHPTRASADSPASATRDLFEEPQSSKLETAAAEVSSSDEGVAPRASLSRLERGTTRRSGRLIRKAAYADVRSTASKARNADSSGKDRVEWPPRWGGPMLRPIQVINRTAWKHAN